MVVENALSHGRGKDDVCRDSRRRTLIFQVWPVNLKWTAQSRCGEVEPTCTGRRRVYVHFVELDAEGYPDIFHELAVQG